jgi:hypothetical protein
MRDEGHVKVARRSPLSGLFKFPILSHLTPPRSSISSDLTQSSPPCPPPSPPAPAHRLKRRDEEARKRGGQRSRQQHQRDTEVGGVLYRRGRGGRGLMHNTGGREVGVSHHTPGGAWAWACYTAGKGVLYRKGGRGRESASPPLHPSHSPHAYPNQSQTSTNLHPRTLSSPSRSRCLTAPASRSRSGGSREGR